MIEGTVIGRITHCRSCGAEVIWAVTENGKRMPVDVERVAGGNVVLEHREVGKPPVARILGLRDLRDLGQKHAANLDAGLDDGNDRLWVSHFVTCPEQNRWRRS